MTRQQQRWRAVGAAVTKRYRALGMQQADVVRASGLSDPTIRHIEAGDLSVKGPRTLTKRKLEDALKWAPGSIDAILAGREPTPVDGDAGPTDVGDLRAVVDHLGEMIAGIADRVEAIERRHG